MSIINEINVQIDELKKRQKERTILERQLRNAKDNLDDKRDEIRNFKIILKKEQKDVDDLTNVTFKNIVTTLFKNKEEVLSKEQKELLDAKMHLDRLESERAMLEEEYEYYKNKKREYKDDSHTIQRLLAEKEEHIKNMFPEIRNEIDRIDSEINFNKEMMIEIDEAINVGHKALHSLSQAERSLKSAQSWGAWDVMGGGIISHMQKHEHIRNANSVLSQVKRQLHAFNNELGDIKFDSNVGGVHLDSMDVTFDFWFDNIFTDLRIQRQIEEGLFKVRNAKKHVRSTLNTVESMKSNRMSNVHSLENQRQDLVERV